VLKRGRLDGPNSQRHSNEAGEEELENRENQKLREKKRTRGKEKPSAETGGSTQQHRSDAGKVGLPKGQGANGEWSRKTKEAGVDLNSSKEGGKASK